MKFVKLTILETRFLLDLIEWATQDPIAFVEEKESAVELLENALEYAEEEEIPDGRSGEIPDGRNKTK